MSEFADLLLVLAASIFQPVIVEAALFIVCFNVAVLLIEWLRGIFTNPLQKGGE